MTREEALQILDTILTIGEQVDALEMAIQALEQEPCEKCKYYDGNSCQHYDYKVGYTQGYEDASNRFRQEPCDDAISRRDVLKTMCEFCPVYNCTSKCSSYEHMTLLPSVTQKSGKWDRSCTCSVCGQWRILESEKNGGKYKYCPNCGARMESEDKE